MKPLVCLLTLLLLTACAAGPRFKTEGVATGLVPGEAARQGDGAIGRRVLWGGVIVASTNLKEATQMEVLAYPLDGSQAPRTDEAPLGRFLIIEPGYLETADYAPGRSVTLVGPVTGSRQGRIGESDYTYPVVDPERIHLWPPESARRTTEPRFHFGVGVIFRN